MEDVKPGAEKNFLMQSQSVRSITPTTVDSKNLENSPQTLQKKLIEQLGLRPNEISRTEVEFNQVFTPRHSKTFLTKWTSTEQKDPQKKDDVKVVEEKRVNPDHNIIRVDERPRHWYRAHRDIQEQIDHFVFLGGTLDKAFQALKANLEAHFSKSDEQNGGKLLAQYDDLRMKILKVRQQTEWLKEQKRALRREIVINGYRSEEIDGKLKVFGKEIVDRKVPLIPDLEKLRFSPDENSLEEWNRTVAKLRDALFLDKKDQIDHADKEKDAKLKKDFEEDLKRVEQDILELLNKKEEYQQTKIESEGYKKKLQEIVTINKSEGIIKEIDDTLKTPEKGDETIAERLSHVLDKHGIKRQLVVDGVKVYSSQVTQNPDLIKVAEYVRQLHHLDAVLSIKRPNQYYDNAVVNLLRSDFIKRWNIKNIKEPKEINPDTDRVLEYFESIGQQQDDRGRDTYYFKLTANGFCAPDGKLLKQFMTLSPSFLSTKTLVLPCFDKSGIPLRGIFQVVIGPELPEKSDVARLPTVKFTETQVVKIKLEGYSAGEVRHAINLLPGESKKLYVERRTKISRTISEMRKEDSDNTQRLSSSFDENIQSELSSATNLTQSDQQVKKANQSNSTSIKSAKEMLSDTSQ